MSDDKTWIVLLTTKTNNFEVVHPCENMLAAAIYIKEFEKLDEVYPTNRLQSIRPGKSDWRFDIQGKPYIYLAEWREMLLAPKRRLT